MYSAFMQYNEVFVTGGSGLLGRYVCTSLIGHGFLPRLFVDPGIRGEDRAGCPRALPRNPGGVDAPRERGDGRTGDLGDRAPRGGMEGAASTGGHLRGSERARDVQRPPLRFGLGDPSADLRRRRGGAPGTRIRTSTPGGERRRWCGGRIVRGPCSAPRPGTTFATESRGSPRSTWRSWRGPSPNRFNGRIRSAAYTRMSSTDRFRWKELSRGS